MAQHHPQVFFFTIGSYYISFNLIVEFIYQVVKICLYMMQDLSHLCNI